jgi:ureidoglycolate hydrolase
MAVLETETDFACLVWEDGSQEDCHEVFFHKDKYHGKFEQDTIFVKI